MSLAQVEHVEGGAQGPGDLPPLDLLVHPEPGVRGEPVAVVEEPGDEAHVDTREGAEVRLAGGGVTGAPGGVQVVLDTQQPNLPLPDQSRVHRSVVEIGEG